MGVETGRRPFSRRARGEAENVTPEAIGWNAITAGPDKQIDGLVHALLGLTEAEKVLRKCMASEILRQVYDCESS
jgi:hypothetical protein